ncbi:MAG: zf-HC2 domain-containing protein [bacterium]
MTECSNGEIRDLLPDLLHQRLDAAERARVEQHVAMCNACSEELALLRDLCSTIRRAPAIDAAAIVAAIPAYRAPVRRSWGGWRAAAAIAAVAIGGTSITLVNREHAVAPSIPIASGPRAESTTVGTIDPRVMPSPSRQTSPNVVPPPTPSAPVAQAVADGAEPAALAVTAGALGDLSDRELSTLLDEIESLDALPSEDVEGASSLAGSISLENAR